jgi:hypothetical protein
MCPSICEDVSLFGMAYFDFSGRLIASKAYGAGNGLLSRSSDGLTTDDGRSYFRRLMLVKKKPSQN